MKITINVSEFYLDGQELETCLKDSIKHDAISEIKKSIKDKVENFINTEIKKQIEDTLQSEMQLYVSEYIKEGKVKSMHDSNKMITIEESVKEKFTYNSGYANVDDKIKDLAKKFGQEMHNRYDLLFASQLVAKMNEVGLLKDDVANKLLNNK